MAAPKVIRVLYDVNRGEIQGAAQDWAAVSRNVGVTEQKAKSLGNEFKKEVGIIGNLRKKEQELKAARDKSNDVGQIKKINAELGKTQKQMSDLTNTTQKTGGGLKGLMGSLSSFAPAIGVGAIAALGKEAIGSAIEFEQLQVSFETFLGSAEKANATIAELESFSAATPFTSEEVLNAGRSLLAFGESADTVTDKLRMIGDISAGTGKDFGELATLFGKARVSGVLMAEDLNQFTEAGIPIIEEFAKILEVPASKVKQLGSDGKITFDTLQQAFSNMTSEGGKFAGLTEKLSQTTGGLLSTLQSNLQILLRDIGTFLLPIVQVFIGYITSVFDTLKSAFAPIIDGFSALGKALGLTGEKGNIVSGIVKVLAFNFKILMLPLTLAGKVLGFLITKIAEFIDNSPRLKAVIDGIKEAFSAVIDTIEAVADWFDNLVSTAEKRMATINLLTQRIHQASKAGIDVLGQLNKSLRKEFRATDAEIKQFTDSFDTELLRNVGTMEEAQRIVSEEFKKWRESTQATGNAMSDLSKKAQPLPGSIAAMQAELKKLNQEFSAATTFQERLDLAGQISALNKELKAAQNPVEDMLNSTEKIVEKWRKLYTDELKNVSKEFKENINPGVTDFEFRLSGLQDDLAEITDEAARLHEEMEAAFNAERFQEFSAAASTVFDQALQLSSSIGSLFDAQTAAQLQQIEEKKQKEIASAEALGQSKEAIEKRYDDQTKKIQKEAAERQKRLAIFQAIINGAQAVLSALDDAPVPYNFVLAGLNAAAAAIQIAAIRAQPIPFAKGGLVTGGEPNKDSVSAVLMPGEWVMRKDTVQKYRPLIEALHNDKLSNLFLNNNLNDKNIVKAIRKSAKSNQAITSRQDRTNQLLAAMLDNQAAFRRPSLRRGY